ncbi:MAG TPA: hypothetical protein DCM02_01085 [Flavobacterium sp.]|nr:hypothetical protein [Flavobacterium sp.]
MRGDTEQFLLAQNKDKSFVTANLENHILQNNLYGVDLNAESVNITKLSLWLKTANKGKKLTSLDENIKCGDSLIDDPSVAGKKAFNWNREFKRVVESGGFDIVIGNPPYIFAREKITEAEKNFYIQSYESAEYQINTFVLFIEKALELTKESGLIGQIVPNSLLKISSISGLRKYLLDNGCINNIVQLHGKSFKKAGVETVIICFEKTKTERNLVKVLNVFKPDDITNQEYIFIDSSSWKDDPKCKFQISTNSSDDLLLEKIKLKTVPLTKLFDVKAGLQAYETGKGKPKQTPEDVKNRPYDFKYQFDDSTFQYLDGFDVERWNIVWSGSWLKYGDNLAASRNFDIFERPRILIREITRQFPKNLICTFVKKTYLNNRSILNVLSRSNDENQLKQLVAILNSTLISWYFQKVTPKAERELYPKIILEDLREFPIIDLVNRDIIERADLMLEKNKELKKAKQKFLKLIQSEFKIQKFSQKLEKWNELDWIDFEKELQKAKVKLTLAQKKEWIEFFENEKKIANEVQEIINQTDNDIDLMVYELYGLTPEEREIVKGKI